MRIAWFSPFPPVRSGISAYSAEVIPLLRERFLIDCYAERPSAPGAPSDHVETSLVRTAAVEADAAHDFVWRHRLNPYDLVVYQLGNARYHDFIWAYLARYPGLVVLHDTKLHQARAAQLLRERRPDDYRAEFWFDHPHIGRDVVEYAVQGLGGPIHYLWSMTGVAVRTAKLLAVHSARVAADLREEHPTAAVDTIRMGVADQRTEGTSLRQRLGIPDTAFVFAVFGNMTAEKRIPSILRALAAVNDPRAFVMFVGDDAGFPALASELGTLGVENRIRRLGYVADLEVGQCLQCADAALCLRWPTAGETSASWLRCLAAGLPTVVSGLPHLSDIPVLDVRTSRPSSATAKPVALSVDLMDEDRSLALAMRRLISDRELKDQIASAGYGHWSTNHTLTAMAADYQRTIERAAGLQAPIVNDLPVHFRDAYEEPARRIARRFGIDLDLLRTRPVTRAVGTGGAETRRRRPDTSREPS